MLDPWMKTMLIAVITAMVTTFALSRFAPRLEARSVRIKAAWAARDAFSGHLLTILSATARLWSSAGVEGRFVEPTDTANGLREFAYVDADGTAHRVGSPLAAGGHR
ncbi:hypothetical protein [Streptomyces antibioticus]|uniref:hypothetical protein n=1 Tax=Streptomyces antibioticus TaxID=1890 RepID=UPI003D70EF4A